MNNPLQFSPQEQIMTCSTTTNTDDNIHLPPTEWERGLSLPKNTNLQLIRSKILCRTHNIQYKMRLSNTDKCSHCTTDEAPPPVQHTWFKVTRELSLILGCSIHLSPSLWIIGDLYSFECSPKHTKLTLVAKKIVRTNWRSKQTININHWSNLWFCLLIHTHAYTHPSYTLLHHSFTAPIPQQLTLCSFTISFPPSFPPPPSCISHKFDPSPTIFFSGITTPITIVLVTSTITTIKTVPLVSYLYTSLLTLKVWINPPFFFF